MKELPPLVTALLDPNVYPHRPAGVTLTQTQMSFVFLAGDYVYKVKKPVDLGYLDYTSLEKRRFFCEQELKLNRRLSPEVYLDVVPVTAEGNRFHLGGKGEVVEYAVKMRRLPHDRMMDVLLPQGRVTHEMLTMLARKLAVFHQGAATGPEISSFGSPGAIKINTDENFSQTKRYIDNTIPAGRYQRLKGYTEDFLIARAALFEKRAREGRIRDCHGDLHAAHVCFGDGIFIFDCIEFNDRFRYCDVASEIAFLAMDLDRYGRGDLSRVFVDAYVGAGGDVELLELLNFYKCYRAYVRGKVEGFKLQDPYISDGEKERVLGVARGYFELADRYTREPFLFITAGLVGTGKTTVADALSRRLGLVHISSDVVRKQLAGVEPTEHHFEGLRSGIYSEEFTGRTYGETLKRAEDTLAGGRSVILDASYKKRAHRLQARDMATKMGATFLVVLCVLEETEVKRRLEQRLIEGAVSDGRWELYAPQKAEFDEVVEFPEENSIIVDTAQPVDQLVELVLKKVLNG